MLDYRNIFFKKKILIYGLGKSGLSALKFLKKNNITYLYDDNKNNIKDILLKKKFISYNKILNLKVDYIIISPGINIRTCKLKKFLKKNSKKIHTDLDVFFTSYSKNKNITITGTNGKSTTAQILFEVLKQQKFDVRLVGNIGNPILLEKKITNKTIFVIEASSYQLEYSKLFKAKLAVLLNISPDHLERHRTLKKYIQAKFRLIKNQTEKDYAIINNKNIHIKKHIKNKIFLPKIIKVDLNAKSINLRKLGNSYFYTDGNKENLSFVLEIAKLLKIRKKDLLKTLKGFSGLKYRQQIIYKSKKITIINDSKATSFSSSASILRSLNNVYWIVGGLAKKGDKFLLSKNHCKNIKAYVFGNDRNLFVNKLKNIVRYESFTDLKFLVKKIFKDLKNNNQNHQTILFSPSAASFDNFKNFEERGKYFNNLIKKFL